ncbi:MAG TPA: hypothetical protein VFP12_00245 [Allosphingosinicella sp.]|nr:hypothetical protein [Allosphingosinicella sp.]
MRIYPAFLPATADPRRLELALRLEDGSSWRLTVSAGMERFIGAYPLVQGLNPGGPLLRFRAADPA